MSFKLQLEKLCYYFRVQRKNMARRATIIQQVYIARESHVYFINKHTDTPGIQIVVPRFIY